jgi:hypothetical protein
MLPVQCEPCPPGDGEGFAVTLDPFESKENSIVLQASVDGTIHSAGDIRPH